MKCRFTESEILEIRPESKAEDETLEAWYDENKEEQCQAAILFRSFVPNTTDNPKLLSEENKG